MEKQLINNIHGVNGLARTPLQSFYQLSSNAGICKDCNSIRYPWCRHNLRAYLTDEGLKRERQQQHKAQLDKLR